MFHMKIVIEKTVCKCLVIIPGKAPQRAEKKFLLTIKNCIETDFYKRLVIKPKKASGRSRKQFFVELKNVLYKNWSV